jgi:hypothetical protein
MTSKRGYKAMDRREFLCAAGLVIGGVGITEGTPFPKGVKAVWDVGKAYRDTTATRERICLNGLWRWQPAKGVADSAPEDGWGYFKVPGLWPGNADYLQEDCQTLYVHPSFKDTNLSAVAAAWHQREITIPKGWDGRRVVLSVEYVNSLALCT